MYTTASLGRIYFLLLSVVVYAQLPAPSELPKPSGTTIVGVVRDSKTNQPVPGILLVLANHRERLRATTNRSGEFSFQQISAGSAVVSVEASNRYAFSTKHLFVRDQSSVQSVTIDAHPAASLSGIVYDGLGHPLRRAAVSIRREGTRGGRQTYIAFYTRYSDDTGRYLVEGLAAGDYVVEASPKALPILEGTPQDPLTKRPITQDTDSVALGIGPTYYGDTTERIAAAVIRISEGEDRRDIDIRMKEIPTTCLVLSLQLPRSGSVKAITVMLAERYPMSQSRVALGTFTHATPMYVCSVVKGNYRLDAFVQFQDDSVSFGSQEVFVSAKLPLQQMPPVQLEIPRTIQGKINVAASGVSAEKKSPPEVLIYLFPVDRLNSSAEKLAAVFSDPFTFHIPAVLNNEYWVQVESIPPGYYVKQITSGGRDALLGTYFPSTQPLEIELADEAPVIKGEVRDQDGQPLGGSTVLACQIPCSADAAPNHLIRAQANATGQFVVSGFPPGRYVVAAFDHIDRGAERSDGILSILSKSEKILDLKLGMTSHLSLTTSAR